MSKVASTSWPSCFIAIIPWHPWIEFDAARKHEKMNGKSGGSIRIIGYFALEILVSSWKFRLVCSRSSITIISNALSLAIQYKAELEIYP